jgi:hypothetical protein
MKIVSGRLKERSRMLLAISMMLVIVGASASAPLGRYTVTAEMVTDTATGLIWQRHVGAGLVSWSGAQNYCSSLSLGGWFSGWRLPNIRELQSIVDIRTFNPAVDATAFPSTPSDYFWASTRNVEYITYSWAVDFRTGDTLIGTASNTARARCVR